MSITTNGDMSIEKSDDIRRSENEEKTSIPREGSESTSKEILRFAKPSDLDKPIYAAVPNWAKTYSFHINTEPHFVMAIEELISRLMNIHGGSRITAIKHIFTTGINHLSENPTYGTNDVRVPLDWAKFIINAKKRAAFFKEIRGIRSELGDDRLRAMAEEANIDLSAVLDEIQRTPGDGSWWENAKDWLVNLLMDCEEHSIEEIKDAAISEEIIADPKKDKERFDKEWANLRAIASSEGYSKGGERGYWKLPCEASSNTSIPNVS